jgi:hypothetical protein
MSSDLSLIGQNRPRKLHFTFCCAALFVNAQSPAEIDHWDKLIREDLAAHAPTFDRGHSPLADGAGRDCRTGI